MEQRITPPSKFSLGFSELWQYRELFYFFTWRDIKVKYKQTFLGFAWAVLQPFIMMVIFSVFFGRALNVPSDGIPYPLFAFSGLMLWNVFSTGLSGAGNSMVSNANIIKKIYFPRLIIPMSAILVAVFDFFMAFIVYIGLVIYFDYSLDLKLLYLLPASLLLTILATFGPGALIACFSSNAETFGLLPAELAACGAKVFLNKSLAVFHEHVLLYKATLFDNSFELTKLVSNALSSIDVTRKDGLESAKLISTKFNRLETFKKYDKLYLEILSQ